jgi:hypothetical protein
LNASTAYRVLLSMSATAASAKRNFQNWSSLKSWDHQCPERNWMVWQLCQLRRRICRRTLILMWLIINDFAYQNARRNHFLWIFR